MNPDPHRPGARRWSGTAAWLACLLAACTPDGAPATAAPPQWIRLASGDEPASIASLVGLTDAWNARDDAFVYRADGERGIFVESALDAAGWKLDESAGRWRHALPPGLVVASDDEGELELGGARMSVPSYGTRPRAVIEGGALALTLRGASRKTPAAGAAPGAGHFGLWLERRPEDPGSSVEERIVVWPGERVERPCDVPAGSALRFQPRVRAVAPDARVTFRVRLDGAVIHEQVLGHTEAPPALVVVDLGASARPGARFVFEVEGDPAVTAFAQPVVGPADVGTPATRPWNERRPDVVLFLADTFRADLLAMHGGDPALTPNLDAIAARSVRFPETRAPSTWTLPSHASLFTGVWPPQHGAETWKNALAPQFVTLAERFEEAGYRTAAVTDGLYLTRAYGLDQGFQRFHVRHELRLSETLAIARAMVDADDGRPLFLFVHTYRMHSPYRSGVEEDARAAEKLKRETTRAMEATADETERARIYALGMEEMREHYRAGAPALDAQIGPWFAALEQRGLFRRGLFVFTSDHGEQFLEHGGAVHGGVPWEEEAHVPLFVFGAGEPPRDVPYGASLIDLAPTLAARCGLEPSPEWAGRDLFTLDEEREIFTSVLSKDSERSLSVVNARHKIHARNRGAVRLPDDLREAFALDVDPGERDDVTVRELDWPRALARRAAAGWRAQQPLVESSETVLDEQLLEELKRLGYGQ